MAEPLIPVGRNQLSTEVWEALAELLARNAKPEIMEIRAGHLATKIIANLERYYKDEITPDQLVANLNAVR